MKARSELGGTTEPDRFRALIRASGIRRSVIDESGSKDAQWWLEKDTEKAYSSVLRVARRVSRNQIARRDEALRHFSLYADRPIQGFGLTSYAKSFRTDRPLTVNVTRNMVNAVTSKVAAKTHPTPSFETIGGDYTLQERAKNLEKFCSGVAYETGFYRMLAATFRDACIYGTGFVKVYAVDKDGDAELDAIQVDRIPFHEVIVDDAEARYGEPRCLYHRRWMDRLRLVQLFPEHEAAIMKATSPDEEDLDVEDTTSDMVLVTESYHRRSGPKAKDGRRAIVIEGATLEWESWDEESFPILALRWVPPSIGWYGEGLVRELDSLQTEINELLDRISELTKGIAGFWWVPKGAKLNPEHINDDGLKVLTGDIPPQYHVQQAVPPEVYQHLERLIQKAYEISGISQLSAQSQKPAGLDSGAALRAYDDIQTERFVEVGHLLEEFVIDVNKAFIRTAREIAKVGAFKIRSGDKSMFRVLDFASDADIEDEKFRMQIFPISSFPATPSGKMAYVQELLNGKLIPPEDALDLLGFPDTEEHAKRTGAPRRIVERNIGSIISRGEYMPPEPMDNHGLALKLVTEAYANARLDGVPADRLQMLRDYAVATEKFLAEKTAPPAPAPPPGAPMGAPPPPPGAMPGAAGPPPMPMAA